MHFPILCPFKPTASTEKLLLMCQKYSVLLPSSLTWGSSEYLRTKYQPCLYLLWWIKKNTDISSAPPSSPLPLFVHRHRKLSVHKISVKINRYFLHFNMINFADQTGANTRCKYCQCCKRYVASASYRLHVCCWNKIESGWHYWPASPTLCIN